MTLKTLAAVGCISLAAASTAAAATFNFSFDASSATSGDTSLRAIGTLDINAAPGAVFTKADLSNVSIVLASDLFSSVTIQDPFAVSGSVANDGLSATFTDFFVGGGGNFTRFGCEVVRCVSGGVLAQPSGLIDVRASFGTEASTLAAFQATKSVSAVPLPAGGLLMLSGIAGLAFAKRRKKTA